MACACCTNTGQRYAGVQKLDASRRGQLDELKFSAAATLYTGERDTTDIKGIATPASDYELHVSQDDQPLGVRLPRQEAVAPAR